MDRKEKMEHLKFLINRYDHYYDSMHNKGNFYLSLNTFLLGGIVTGFFMFKATFPSNKLLLILMIITVVLNLLSLLTALASIKPYLNKAKQNLNGSLIYFGDIANYQYLHFNKLVNEMNYETYFEDLTKQTHLLAIGLNNKYNLLYWSTVLLAMQTILISIIGLIILNK